MEQRVATALNRVISVLERRPSAGMHADAPAVAHWNGGLSVTTTHPDGAQIQTDMPLEFGGRDNAVSPGWLMRAGLSACAATCIAMLAARHGVELTGLDVQASSRSDARGLFGMTQAGNERISPAPLDMQLRVRIAASNSLPEQLRALVEEALTCSPVSVALLETTQIRLHIDEGAT
ncbi:OsmC family protein [Povalibacter sp.]|uniref:OsmC family protein n=1 Tax=Povalibacter sp. TaxID=1962978 RepID=UPI002F4204F0